MSVFLDNALLPDGWAANVRLRFADGAIVAVEPDCVPTPGEARGAIGVPGLHNLHSHAFQRGMAGLSELRGPADDNFWTWREVMYRFLARLAPEDVEAISALAYLEMLERGFTRVGEFHYLHHDPSGQPYADPAELAGRVAAAAGATGIALTLLPCFYAHGGFGGAAPVPGQRRFITGLDGFARLLEASRAVVATLPGGAIGIAPHSLRATTQAELEALLALAPEGPVHMHLAEQVREVEDCVAWSGARPAEWLLDHAAVDARWCLIHATHITPEEARRLAATGAVAGLCPITEANLGDGIFPAEHWDGRYGVGTDSNVRIGVAEELRQLEYAQRLGRRGRNLLAAGEGSSTGRTIFDAALVGGAAALGAVAGLQEGAPADLVTLQADDPGLLWRAGDAWIDGWLFAGAAVDCVWAHGRQVVAGGRHVAREAVQAGYAAAMARVLG